MPLYILNPFSVQDLTTLNPTNRIYFRGANDEVDSWRAIALPQEGELPPRLSFQHFETLDEIDITLDDAKVASIELLGNTEENRHYASVLTDTRTNMSTPPGISGDMTGRVVEHDGSVWFSMADEWFQKGFFLEGSFFSDRGIFQRMNVARTDPDDPRAFPPAPTFGTTLGARNSLLTGDGVEMLSITNKDGFFGMVPAMGHGPTVGAIDNLVAVTTDENVQGIEFARIWNPSIVYIVGDNVIVQGIRYICNTAGLQVGVFTDNIALWDPVLNLANYNNILIGSDGNVMSGEDGNVLISDNDP